MTKVLFTVDMMNEGLHGKDISVGILMRQTNSPIIFYQQIGLCFSIGQTEQPIIIDLVNNFQRAYIKNFKAEYELEVDEQEEIFSDYSGKGMFIFDADPTIDREIKSLQLPRIEFIDETKDIQEIFKAFGEKAEHWEVYYLKAQSFFQQNGHLDIPKKDRRLYNWIINQRYDFMEESLSPEKIERLTAIGMGWDKSQETAWLDKFNRYELLVEQNGGKEPTFIKDRELSYWVKWQRKKYAEDTLSDEHKNLLSPIMSFDGSRINLWNNRLELLKEHKETQGKFNLTQKDPIYKEIEMVRVAYKNNTLPQSVFKALVEMRFQFGRNKTWEESFRAVEDFKRSNGRLPIRQDDKQLSNWINAQRQNFRNQKLKDEYLQPLIALGVIQPSQQT